MQAITRRRFLASSAGFLVLDATRRAFALDPVRQGYQTNIWGMPTYYLLRSGLLEARGIKIEEFAVPSGNLTMQQMVARQVDLGTYAAQSFIIGHDKGGLVAVAQIEIVGKTAQIVTRRDLNIGKVEELKGRKVANQTGSSVGNVFVDIIAVNAGLKKGDFQEVRMDVNNMDAAMAARSAFLGNSEGSACIGAAGGGAAGGLRGGIRLVAPPPVPRLAPPLMRGRDSAKRISSPFPILVASSSTTC